MRELSVNVAAALRENPVRSFLMVRVYDATTVYLNSTDYTDILALSNGWTYVNDGRILGVDPPRMSTNVDRAQYSARFADPQMLMGGYTNWIGKEADIRMGFLSPTGTPFTDIADTFNIYHGRIDGAGYKIDTSTLGESIFQLTCSSPMADLDRTNYIYLSRDFIRSRNIKDTCCDMVYAGSSTISLKWGRT